ncbi:hypothetical protein A4A49_59454 [Nicotiana attenuata]|uniref:Uncharacterized protein n=1 Tax=Nicotiana attenuata TaxID=49451 RepID=A0A1J6K3X2_NICAT|nr:hypothetical protein A4A49_39285 [Nicotiana attenuata]OIT28798.1 hypothetical protein A4A49_59454 [Nicotiana attenuata]
MFTLIPQMPLAADNIESSLKSAIGTAGFISQVLSYDEAVGCIFNLGDAGRALELAINKYHKHQVKDVIKQIDEAINDVNICLQSSDVVSRYIADNIVQDITNLQLFIKKIKKEASRLGSKVVGSALSPA